MKILERIIWILLVLGLGLALLMQIGNSKIDATVSAEGEYQEMFNRLRVQERFFANDCSAAEAENLKWIEDRLPHMITRYESGLLPMQDGQMQRLKDLGESLAVLQ